MAEASFVFNSSFLSYISTLKETSLDDKHTSYMCQDESQVVYNFDLIVKERYPQKQPASYDSLLIDGDRIFCIEFKNQKYSKINRAEIVEKLTNGKAVLEEIFAENNINKSMYEFVFCVVYKNHHSVRWRRGIEKNEIQFGLEFYKDTHCNQIYTNDIGWFTHEFKKHFHKELAC